MKITSIYLFSTALILLTACQKEEIQPSAQLSGDPIRFSPSVTISEIGTERFSKAPVDLFPSGGSFGVLGYCLANYDGSNELDPTTGPSQWDSKAVLSSPHLFYKTEVKYNGTVCYYTGEQRRWYEPTDYLYTFFAYYPYGDNFFTIEPGTQSGIGFPAMTFTMPFSGGTLTTVRQIDDIPDAMAAASIDITRQEGSVGLQFNHLLTGINFTINNHNETNDLIIHGLRVSGNFYRSIRIHTDQGLDFPSETFAGAFVFLDGDDDADDLAIEHSKTVKKAGDKTLLLISNLEAGPNYIGNAINLHIDYSFMGTRTTDKIIALPTGYLPQGGTIYTIEINFIGDAFILNFVVDNNQVWEEGGDSNIHFE